ncbi:hypothetical protein BU26DRAFT_558953 [Trematosphaeria pertusa]|uniref:Uncharacterized protein n=1 Tax=Trematosphaeria pertusa TaxID=390896 RepID=A0A6A6IUK6_9PLEO|nr:uncharacterized protein BU26DRAFT_558953 [Trematosphaeria pertusa]KAF2254245.1 hypothetical protein BU26DRAFT_558953 [Trematosphaeria pertusa]
MAQARQQEQHASTTARRLVASGWRLFYHISRRITHFRPGQIAKAEAAFSKVESLFSQAKLCQALKPALPDPRRRFIFFTTIFSEVRIPRDEPTEDRICIRIYAHVGRSQIPDTVALSGGKFALAVIPKAWIAFSSIFEKSDLDARKRSCPRSAVSGVRKGARGRGSSW